MSGDVREVTAAEREQQLRRLVQLESESARIRHRLSLSERRMEVPESEPPTEADAYALIRRIAGDVLSIHSVDGTYLWVSPSCESLFGWRPDQLVGTSAYDFFHPDDIAAIAEVHEEHIERLDVTPVDYRIRRVDGSYRWVSTTSTNHKDDKGVPQIVCLTRDIAERREREEKLHALVAQLQCGEDPHKGDFLCLCAWCKSVRRSDGNWDLIEAYLDARSNQTLTHGVCPTCVERLRAR